MLEEELVEDIEDNFIQETIMKKFVTLLITLSLLFSQELCEGTCFSDDEVKNLFNSINTLEQKDSLNVGIIKSLEMQCN